jgi:uncharacterized OB-fold protein
VLGFGKHINRLIKALVHQRTSRREKRLRGAGADGQYWKALSAGRLQMQQCGRCRRWNWPAVWRCGECGSWDHAWHDVPLRGRIFTWTRTWHDFGAAPDFGLPFVSVLVSLEDAGQRRLLGTLEGNDRDIFIGAAVTGEIGKVTVDGMELPALRWRIDPGQTSPASLPLNP